jgi:uncharacterized protein (TIGR02996 family)
MDEETALLQSILAHPDDEVAKLVFADWLEERGRWPGHWRTRPKGCGHELPHLHRVGDLRLRGKPFRVSRCAVCAGRLMAYRITEGNFSEIPGSESVQRQRVFSMQPAGALFERIRSLAERPLKEKFDLDEIESIEFPTDEEAHNDALQAAARKTLEGMLEMIVAGARDVWGKPDYRLTEVDEELPPWVESIPLGFDVLVAWKRPRKVAFALIWHEDREIPINLFVGVVRSR